MMTGKNLTNTQLQQCVDRTFQFVDKDEDGRISYEEFKRLVMGKAALARIAPSIAVEI